MAWQGSSVCTFGYSTGTVAATVRVANEQSDGGMYPKRAVLGYRRPDEALKLSHDHLQRYAPG